MDDAAGLIFNGLVALVLSDLIWRMTGNFWGWLALFIPGSILVLWGWIVIWRNR